MANGGSANNLANAWHIPDSAEPPGQPGMRTPTGAVAPSAAVTVISGNQFQGAGRPGNQLQAGSALLFRKATDAVWSSEPLTFLAESGNNKYFSATIPPGTFKAGEVVQYYLKIAYSDHATTFLHGTDIASSPTDQESVTQAAPFSFTVAGALDPSGPFLSFRSGAVEARVYRDTGHVQVAGPDLAGAPLANAVTFTPPSVVIAGRASTVGRLVSSTSLPDGLELTQALDAGTVTARLTSPADGVVRYEVTDWKGTPPDQATVQAPSDPSERFYGFGEKFNAFDQSGKVVHTITFDHPGNKDDHSYKPAPWFVSTRGYGFHLDSTAESTFDLRASAPDRYAVTNLFSTLKYQVVYGPRLTDVLIRYASLTGRPFLPPRFAFGPWISSDVWRNGGEIRYAVTKFRQRKLPVSAIVFDSPWELAYNDFAFNKTQFAVGGTFEGAHFDGFASFGDMCAFFQKNGLKLICWMTPFVNTSSKPDPGVAGQNLGQAANYKAGSDGGFFVRRSEDGKPLTVPWWKGTGSPVDFTNPHEIISGKDPARSAPILGTSRPSGIGKQGTNLFLQCCHSFFKRRSGHDWTPASKSTASWSFSRLRPREARETQHARRSLFHQIGRSTAL